jgi:hypothetical protein
MATAQGEIVAKMTNGAHKPIRFRKARRDALIGSLQTTIESKFGLPSGSVKLVHPSGRRARSNSSVQAFKNRWTD